MPQMTGLNILDFPGPLQGESIIRTAAATSIAPLNGAPVSISAWWRKANSSLQSGCG
jgi:hypothetical protein